jgi:hypothetical protein
VCREAVGGVSTFPVQAWMDIEQQARYERQGTDDTYHAPYPDTSATTTLRHIQTTLCEEGSTKSKTPLSHTTHHVSRVKSAISRTDTIPSCIALRLDTTYTKEKYATRGHTRKAL